jgi:mannosyltransferase
MKREKDLDLIIIVSLILLNIIIKSLFLNVYNIDLDEPFTIYHAQGSLLDIAKLLRWENNPPLYFVILHFWINFFGIGAISVRFLPMLFGSLAVYFIYKIGKKYINTFAAIGASLLYTFSNENIGQAHDTRVYTLFVLLTAASMYFYCSMIDAEKKRKYMVGLTIANTLLMYSHFLSIFVLLTQAICALFLNPLRKHIFKKYILSSCIVFICYLPYLYTFILRFHIAVNGGLWTPRPEISNLFSFLLAYCNNLRIAENLFLGILLLFIVILIFSWKKAKLSIYQIILISWFVIPYVSMFFISYKLPIITPLYMIFFIPAFYLTVMLAICYITNVLSNYLNKYAKFLGVAVTLAGLCLMLENIDLNYSYGFQGAKAASIIRENKTDSTGVLIAPIWIQWSFTYNYDLEAFKDFGKFEKHLKDENIFIVSAANDIDTAHIANFSDIILMDGWDGMRHTDPNKTILGELKRRFEHIDTIAQLNYYKIYRFSSKTKIRSLEE